MFGENALTAPENYPAEFIEEVRLRTGTVVTLRPVVPSDAPLLQAGFARLSPQTIYLRFLEATKQLTDEQARQFASVDYQSRMAFVATIPEDGVERIIGSARYGLVDDPAEGLAESAIVIADDFQGQGLGTIMLDRLIRYARTHGVQAFLATIHVSNARILRFIQRSGLPFDREILEPGVWKITIQLHPA
jgi:acetyltransferase